ncbi:MAG: chemotaxis protein, partial [Alphaproteobacteria bacterium]|nr:chemotaxis protein [Alphaproteobacteria bacterium]
MAYARRQRANLDIWPGFVDALASLLMVIIFLLMIFVVSQFYLNEEIVGRDKALERLQNRVSEQADMLALERETSAD